MNELSRILGLLPLLFLVIVPQFATGEPVRIVIEVEPDLERGKTLYELCASCHLPEGWGNRDGTYPGLAGQHQSVLIKQLIDIREGRRDNPIMFPFVQDRTIGEVKNLAHIVAYIATLPINLENSKGPWAPDSEEFLAGESLYAEQCRSCHGAQGEGDDAALYPRLQGQHYAYLLRQAGAIKSGRRKNSDPAMQAVTAQLSEQELHQVVSYISYLPYPASKPESDISEPEQ